MNHPNIKLLLKDHPDPVFSGLAWALIFGLIASTLFILVLISVACFVLFRPRSL